MLQKPQVDDAESDPVVDANAPSFGSISPASPSADDSPLIRGTLSETTTSVSFYSDAVCTSLLGTGTRAEFEGAGVALTMPQNPVAATPIYAQATSPSLGLSTCSLLTSYRHDSVAPTLSSLSPADNATGVSATVNLVMTFSEAVDVESGDIVIYRASDDAVIETIPVGDAKVTGTGTTTITINPASTLASSTEYYVLVAATAFDDTAGNSYAGIAVDTAWSFTTADSAAPTISTLSPADNAADVAVTANLVMTFSEAVDVESGNIVIYRASDDQVFETIPVGDARVTGTGTTTITINPTGSLASSTEYYVLVATTAFDDTAGNSYAGITADTVWSFTTAAATSIERVVNYPGPIHDVDSSGTWAVYTVGQHLYLLNLSTGASTLVSKNASNTPRAIALSGVHDSYSNTLYSTRPRISADGNWVVYLSQEEITGVTPDALSVYLYDRVQGTNTLFLEGERAPLTSLAYSTYEADDGMGGYYTAQCTHDHYPTHALYAEVDIADDGSHIVVVRKTMTTSVLSQETGDMYSCDIPHVVVLDQDFFVERVRVSDKNITLLKSHTATSSSDDCGSGGSCAAAPGATGYVYTPTVSQLNASSDGTAASWILSVTTDTWSGGLQMDGLAMMYLHWHVSGVSGNMYLGASTFANFNAFNFPSGVYNALTFESVMDSSASEVVYSTYTNRNCSYQAGGCPGDAIHLDCNAASFDGQAWTYNSGGYPDQQDVGVPYASCVATTLATPDPGWIRYHDTWSNISETTLYYLSLTRVNLSNSTTSSVLSDTRILSSFLDGLTASADLNYIGVSSDVAVSGLTHSGTDFLVYNTTAGTWKNASSSLAGSDGNNTNENGILSGDGAWSIFSSGASNLGITNSSLGIIRRTTPD